MHFGQMIFGLRLFFFYFFPSSLIEGFWSFAVNDRKAMSIANALFFIIRLLLIGL